MEFYCKSKSIEDENLPYIIKYSMNPIRIIISSKKMISYLAESSYLHLDATYKINIYEYPVVVVGFSDLNRKFHVAAIAILEFEDYESLNWVFCVLKNFIHSLKKNFRHLR